MTTPTKRTFGETLNTWVQTVGILIAAAWGVWTFYFKEVDAPKSAPVNISMNLQLKTLGVVRDKEEFVVVEMKVTATNASPRKIYLLRSAWIAMGAWTERRDKENDSFQQSADSALKEGTGRWTERHAASELRSVVAVGSLFTDDALNPGETIGRTLLLHVPPGKYHWLDVQAVMPSVGIEGQIEVEWSLLKDGLHPAVYRLGPKGERHGSELKTGDLGALNSRIGMQSARSISALSLVD